MKQTQYQGGCQCGNVRYKVSAKPAMAALCHCKMCRHAHAAPAVAWAMFGADQVSFNNKQPTQYASSEDAKRGFCSNCGTQVSFEATYLPGMIDISMGSLDDPNLITPAFEYWYEEHLDWFKVEGEQPRYAQWPHSNAE